MGPITQVVKSNNYSANRRWVMPVVLGIILLVISISAYLGVIIQGPQKKSPAATTYTIKARSVYSEGNVWTIVSGIKKPINEEDILDEGTQIFTDNGAKLVLSFDDGSVIRIAENSSVSLSQLKPTLMRITEFSGN